ncbi:protoheme IX farnesyltransferase [Ureibacillus massiliensis 4400831 = CIP 108448 = CCUG 49529]|uniref:Protoheme IX farnesyltransferase n=1 Tax=Ureibacillus massiliensis 4400831 = CIP 108448 = CCUG 49529 TaxID=1211035 RepID=A0A0A3J570_9BACL|nr:heme o synthase [Ureibacillus massiliensis]KGR92194.1 protoheme IX farnesyltransferase [Ureibacillus massiliensis 4400831 = CIP 108448 = CCUG 49529]
MSNDRALTAARKTGPVTNSFLKDFLALIKIGIVNSNLVTTFTGMWLAFQFTGLHFLQYLDLIAYTMLGAALIIGGSAAMNNYIDQDIDPIMKRTKARPTVTGRFKPNIVLTISLSFLIVGEILLFTASIVAGMWGLIGILAYVVLYTIWAKRRFVSNTVVGSISGAIPPIIGWAAVDPTFSWETLALFLIMFAWQPPHFYALAMKRKNEYSAANIPMLPVVKGFRRTKISMLLWILLLIPLPFLLYKLGIVFLVLATLLNLGWLCLAISGFSTKDDIKWANKMFVYSLNHMTTTFVLMIIFAIFI